MLEIISLLEMRNLPFSLAKANPENSDKMACYLRSREEFTAKVVTTVTEALQLIEAGFYHVCDMGEVKPFRKRK